MAKMNIKNSDLTTCESLRKAMREMLPAIGDAAHAGDSHSLYELTRVWLSMRRMVLARERSIGSQVDVAFDSMVAE